ncbi:hypothetical protein HELRODRAFT_166009 [Helobdella robusta]|uniref:Uncharacterized protein n=1 Tax=Helobdella robusta TaxID=6412 RepID=T1EXL1_HELRO|nr:hypothetical protein HELRODRAFT_166009 [Helobdella robusta]ESN90351.1 hypothetical protein HELRODRAFT_166009 [Helobdella robusta]
MWHFRCQPESKEVHHVTFAEHTDQYVINSDSGIFISNDVHVDVTEVLPDAGADVKLGKPGRPIIKLQKCVSLTNLLHSIESQDNPFLMDGELSRKADYIINNSTISRKRIRISDPDFETKNKSNNNKDTKNTINADAHNNIDCNIAQDSKTENNVSAPASDGVHHVDQPLSKQESMEGILIHLNGMTEMIINEGSTDHNLNFNDKNSRVYIEKKEIIDVDDDDDIDDEEDSDEDDDCDEIYVESKHPQNSYHLTCLKIDQPVSSICANERNSQPSRTVITYDELKCDEDIQDQTTTFDNSVNNLACSSVHKNRSTTIINMPTNNVNILSNPIKCDVTNESKTSIISNKLIFNQTVEDTVDDSLETSITRPLLTHELTTIEIHHNNINNNNNNINNNIINTNNINDTHRNNSNSNNNNNDDDKQNNSKSVAGCGDEDRYEILHPSNQRGKQRHAVPHADGSACKKKKKCCSLQ